MRNQLHNAGACLLLLIFALLAGPASAQAPPRAAPVPAVEVQALAPINSLQNFDAVRATDTYLEQVSDAERIRGDTYFEGRYWLALVRVLYALAVAAALLWLRMSSAMRDLAVRLTPSPFWQVPVYALQYIFVMTVLTFPLTLYQNFAREQLFGISNQGLLQWLGDFVVAAALNLVLVTAFLTILYWVIRKASRTWWLWGAGLGALYLAFVLALTPSVLLPLFVHSEALPDGQMKTEIRQMAAASGLPNINIRVSDISDRNNRLGTTVAGFGSGAQILVSDNLMKSGTPAEIKIAVAQEIGHVVMHHDLIELLFFSVLIFVGFAFANYNFQFLTKRFGANWQVERLDDPAGLPVLIAAGTVFFLCAMPVHNYVERTLRHQDDQFALNTAREPDALATLTLKQSAYRKLAPGELEEDLFFSEPSGRSRIGTAMYWKAEHLKDQDIADGPISPQ